MFTLAYFMKTILVTGATAGFGLASADVLLLKAGS